MFSCELHVPVLETTAQFARLATANTQAARAHHVQWAATPPGALPTRVRPVHPTAAPQALAVRGAATAPVRFTHSMLIRLAIYACCCWYRKWLTESASASRAHSSTSGLPHVRSEVTARQCALMPYVRVPYATPHAMPGWRLNPAARQSAPRGSARRTATNAENAALASTLLAALESHARFVQAARLPPV
jgi:hypothetical protein